MPILGKRQVTPFPLMALASSLSIVRHWSKPNFWWLTSCGSCARSISLSTRKYDVSRDVEERGSNFPPAPSVTAFPSRLISLLREGVGGRGGGGGGERREGVGGVSEQLMTAARRDLLRSLEATENQLLSPEKATSILCQHYERVRGDMEQRLALISVLASDLAVNHSSVQHFAGQLSQIYHEVPDTLVLSHSDSLILAYVHSTRQRRSEVALMRSESHLRQVLIPFHRDLFTEISRLQSGVQFLVNLRADLLEHIKTIGDHSSTYLLSEMAGDLRDLLAQLFSPSLLDMQQLTWESPCDIMEKVSEYEAVHRLRHWKDLKHRVSCRRRCFVFTHRCLPREPLVILHIALTTQPSSNIKALLDRSSERNGDLSDVTTAVFYSISSTQRGLSGIDLGYYIIRRVVDELQREFPGQLATFVTLSPIPGFRRWLESHLQQPDPLLERERDGGGGGEVELLQLFPEARNLTEALQKALATRDWIMDRGGALANALRSPLLSLCGRYLVQEKRRRRALDPVAHFHLSGGATVWRLNWLADTSPLGLQNSYGVMTNYHYCLPQLNVNSDRYRASGRVAVSDSVHNLLNQLE